MRDADWTSLVYSVERGECILMLGPDAVSGTLNGERLPLLTAMAHFVKDKLGPSYAHLDPSRLSSVAQAAVSHEDPFTLQGWVDEFYREFESDTDVLRNLAELPFALVVSTSPGLSAQHVFREVKPNTHADFYDRTSRAREALPDPTPEAPDLYNIYGSLEQPASLILSDSDRLDFIVSVVSDDPPLPPKLKSALRDPNRSLLFLGFDLGQWQLRVLLHVLAGESQRRYKSFALEVDEGKLDAGAEDFYRVGHKIHFVQAPLESFASELRSRVNVTAAPEDVGDDHPSSLPPGAPVVFICHVSADKPVARKVSEALQASGINTWLDENELRGGDSWDEMIRRTLREVDYVLVLQSKSLRDKDIGYVNREISIALDRQAEYRPPRRFVIPVVVDSPDHRLDELAYLQAPDLSTESGMDELVRSIKRDLNLKERRG